VIVRTTSGELKRISVYGCSWEECDEKITRLKADNYAGIGAPVSNYTVSRWLTYWLEDVVKPARKPSTYVGYEVAVRLYLVPQLGKVKLTALTTADVRGMLNRIRQQCQCCAQEWDAKRPESKRRCCAVGKCCGRVPNPARVHHVFRTLRAALGVAVAEEVLTRNGASFAKPTRPRRHRFQTWSVAEVTTFLAAITSTGCIPCSRWPSRSACDVARRWGCAGRYRPCGRHRDDGNAVTAGGGRTPARRDKDG
jgi:hypothetical protein